MKKFTLFIVVSMLMTGCTYFKETVKLKQVVKEKERIDKTENPARKYFLKLELSEKQIVLNNILVKDVTPSTNIDYDFCVMADVEVDGKKIECYIYSKNIRTIARLKKGKSRINVKGDFGRFFSMLDDYYTKIEVIKSNIDIIEKTQTTEKKSTKDADKEKKPEDKKSKTGTETKDTKKSQ